MNEEAFASIIEETKSIVLKAIRKNLFSEYYYAINDVVQETYIRAYRSLVKNKFKGQSKLSSWLFIIARNESIRMNKKLKSGERRREKYIKKNMEYLNDGAKDNIEKKIEKGDLVLKLNEAVKKLPRKYEDVFDLYVKGFNEKQIAKFLSISRGTVKSRIHRGKERLRKILDKEKIYV